MSNINGKYLNGIITLYICVCVNIYACMNYTCMYVREKDVLWVLYLDLTTMCVVYIISLESRSSFTYILCPYLPSNFNKCGI